MTKSSRPQKYKTIEDNITKDVRILFTLKKKETDDTFIKDIRNLFILKKENEAIIEHLEILGTFFNMKNKIITNQ